MAFDEARDAAKALFSTNLVGSAEDTMNSLSSNLVSSVTGKKRARDDD